MRASVNQEKKGSAERRVARSGRSEDEWRWDNEAWMHSKGKAEQRSRKGTSTKRIPVAGSTRHISA